MSKILFLFCFAFVCCWDMGYGQKITEHNWYTHPQILHIRQQYREIQQHLASGQISKEIRTFEHGGPYQDTEKTWFRDHEGRIRVYKKFGGSEDSALERYFYYDDKGELFFVFINGGSVNGTSIEHRIYVKEGKRIWEMKQIIEGPGWGFPDPWPEADIEWQPVTQ
ncbi:MAG: hypothetical protein AAF587_24285 [Bacteroidota bacterium]